MGEVTVSSRGADRWVAGHPWIFASDVLTVANGIEAGAVTVKTERGRPLGWALYSPHSEIALRLIDRDLDAQIDGAWWHDRLAAATARRSGLADIATAYRLVHAEADGCPSLVVDRYDQWLVVQLASAGVERYRAEIVQALQEITGAAGMLARNDMAVRTKEGLSRTVELLA